MKLHADRQTHIDELRKEAERLTKAAKVIEAMNDDQWKTAVEAAEAAGAKVLHPSFLMPT